MRNLIMMSPYASDLEEFSVPIDVHINACLEQILNRCQSRKDTRALKYFSNELAQHTSTGSYTNLSADQASSGHGSGGKKRKNKKEHLRRGQGDNGEGADDEDNDQDDMLSAQKHGNNDNTGRLSCPFRKKNAIRFNVRHHPQCATQSYANFYLLK